LEELCILSHRIKIIEERIHSSEYQKEFADGGRCQIEKGHNLLSCDIRLDKELKHPSLKIILHLQGCSLANIMDTNDIYCLDTSQNQSWQGQIFPIISPI
jgi:hypothetical protein